MLSREYILHTDNGYVTLCSLHWLAVLLAATYSQFALDASLRVFVQPGLQVVEDRSEQFVFL